MSNTIQPFFETPNHRVRVELDTDGEFSFDVESGCCCDGFQYLTQEEARKLVEFLQEHLQ